MVPDSDEGQPILNNVDHPLVDAVVLESEVGRTWTAPPWHRSSDQVQSLLLWPSDQVKYVVLHNFIQHFLNEQKFTPVCGIDSCLQIVNIDGHINCAGHI